jgi:hypothetical protein
LATYRGIDGESFWKKPVNPKIGLNPPSKRKEKKRKEKTTEVEGF